MGTLTLPLPLTLQLRTMKGGVVTRLRLIVFLPSILVLWDDKGTLAGSVPQRHDYSYQDYSDDKCTFRGKEYMVGETRKSGCNTCTCRGAWRCTERECIEPVKCLKEEKEGEFFCKKKNSTIDHPKFAPCCDGLKCVAYECRDKNAPDEKCILEGKEYEQGESRLCSDGCNTCTCTEGGGWMSTLMACKPLE